MRKIFLMLVLPLLLMCDNHDDGRGGLIPSDSVRSEPAGAGSVVFGEYIVKLNAGIEKSAIDECFGAIGPVIIKKSITENMHLITFKRDPGLDELKKRAAGCPGVSFIQPNYRYRTQGRNRYK